ncbi:ThuA domain-containing protein [bacterium]|nr:ThuA domain-containing protein [bacterium]
MRLCRSMVVFLWVGAMTLRADEPINVLLVGKEVDHPYGTHMYLFECELLAKCLRKMPGFEVTVSDGWPTDPKVLARTNVLVSYSADAGSRFLAGPPAKDFSALMDRGVGLVCLHWSTGCANNEVGPRWRETLGGWFSLEFSRLAVTPAKVLIAGANHPIARGCDDFDLRDEYYLGLRFHEKAEPIAKVRLEGEEFPIAWSFARPQGGRSFGMVCGHFHDVFLNPTYRRLAIQAVLWTAGRDVPAEGVPIEIEQADGILPPEKQK